MQGLNFSTVGQKLTNKESTDRNLITLKRNNLNVCLKRSDSPDVSFKNQLKQTLNTYRFQFE